MNSLAPIVVFFQDLLGELATVSHALELTHDHAMLGAALTGFAQAIGQSLNDVFQIHFVILP